ncbi:MAG: histidine phosphatase family protein [Pseudomonadota bacterium]
MIYLIRHGEAAASWGEHPDPGLSDRGSLQADAVAQKLMGFEISNAVTSPMTRCQETAAAFAHTSGLQISIEPRVTEIPTPTDVGDRRVWLRALMAGQWGDTPDLVKAWHADLLEAANALPNETAVFSHFIAINAIVGHLTGSDAVTVFRPNYCSVTVLEQTGSGLKLIERGESLDTRVL